MILVLIKKKPMPDFIIVTEPIFAGESVEQYRERIHAIAALSMAAEKRIWERKKLAEINKAKIELTNIVESMKTKDEQWIVPEHIRRWARSLRETLEAFNSELYNVKQQSTMSDNKTITIEAPEGFEVDKEKSTDTVIKFKKKESNRPMSWGDFKSVSGYYIGSDSEILSSNCSALPPNRNVWPTKKLAEAALALSQLLQLRDAWNGCNTEEMNLSDEWYGIINQVGGISEFWTNHINMPLRFKTEKTRDAFLTQFRPLIETALPLL
jgi:hypothetical protein